MNSMSDQRNFRLTNTNKRLCHEIAEHKWTQAELKKFLALLQATLESNPSGIIVLNYQEDKFICQEEIVSLNQKFVEMWQVPDAIIKSRNPKQHLAFCCNQLKDPTALTRGIQELQNQLNVKSYSVLELKDGRIFEQHPKLLRLGKQIIGIAWSFLDITEHKRVQEELLDVNSARLQKHSPLRELCAAETHQVSKPMLANTAALSANSKSIFPSLPQLSEVFSFIEANYHQPITLSGVAQAVGYSPAYLTDLVRRQTGQTVNRWIVERRMAAACSLLLETDRSVDQIATAVGYQNTGHFFRQFRQYHRTTPCAWRKAHQAQFNTKQKPNNH